MLSRTARFAAALTIIQAALALVLPAPAAAATPFECGGSGGHWCCVDAPECPDTHTFCCWFDSPNGNMSKCHCVDPE